MDSLLALKMFVGNVDAVSPPETLDVERGGFSRLTVPAAFGQRLISTQLGLFMAKHPQLTLDITLTDAIADIFANRAAPLAWLGFPGLAQSAVVGAALCSPQKIVASPQYLQIHGIPATPEDLRAHYCLHLHTGAVQQPWNFQKGDLLTRVAVSGRIKSNQSDLIREVAVAGLGIALLPDWLVNQDIADGLLISLFPTHVVFPDSTGTETSAPLLPEHLKPDQMSAFISFITRVLEPCAQSVQSIDVL